VRRPVSRSAPNAAAMSSVMIGVVAEMSAALMRLVLPLRRRFGAVGTSAGYGWRWIFVDHHHKHRPRETLPFCGPFVLPVAAAGDS
jgi:hypothetical protein